MFLVFVYECCGQSAAVSQCMASIIVAANRAGILLKLMICEQTHLMEVMNSGKYFGRDPKGLGLPIIVTASIRVNALT